MIYKGDMITTKIICFSSDDFSWFFLLYLACSLSSSFFSWSVIWPLGSELYLWNYRLPSQQARSHKLSAIKIKTQNKTCRKRYKSLLKIPVNFFFFLICLLWGDIINFIAMVFNLNHPVTDKVQAINFSNALLMLKEA